LKQVFKTYNRWLRLYQHQQAFKTQKTRKRPTCPHWWGPTSMRIHSFR